MKRPTVPEPAPAADPRAPVGPKVEASGADAGPSRAPGVAAGRLRQPESVAAGRLHPPERASTVHLRQPESAVAPTPAFPFPLPPRVPGRRRDAADASTAKTWPAWLLLLPVAFLGLFFAYPLWQVLQSAVPAPDAWRWAGGDYVLRKLRVAFLQATLSVLLTLALALPLAWHHHRRAIPWSRAHLALHAAPFILPVFVVVFGIRELFGPRGWLAAATGVDFLAVLGPLGAVVLAHAYYNYGFAARLLHAHLELRPHRLEEAARVLGAGPAASFWRVTVPLLAPAFASVALLVFLFSFTSFGVVLLMGGTEIETLETLLYQNLIGVRPRVDRAAVLGIVQLGINVALLVAYFGLLRRTRMERDPQRRPLPARPVDRAIAVATLALGLLPALSVLVGGFRLRGAWTLEPWRAILDATHDDHVTDFNLWAALDRSLFFATWTAALSLGLALLLGYGLRRASPLRRRALELVAALPLGTSSVLLGFAYIITFGAGAWLDLRASLTVIVVAHTLVAFPFVTRALLPALDALPRRLDEAAAMLGAAPWHTALRVHWPLLRGPLLVAAGFAAALSLGDFGASLILMRQENMHLAIWIERHDLPFDLMRRAQATALTGLLMLLAAGAYLVVEWARPREVLP